METRKFFNEELGRLRQDILAMASMVEENLGKALAALRTRSPDLAMEVRAADAKVDALQNKIEDNAAMIIATQQPVARDLREMVAIFKITSNLERAGDHAVHLSRAAKKLSKRDDSPFRAQEHLEKIADIGRVMLRSAVSAYLKQDAGEARAAAEMDDKIDKEHKALTVNIVKVIKKDPNMVKSALQILHTSGQLERLGDHITNICEGVIYMVEGKREELNE